MSPAARTLNSPFHEYLSWIIFTPGSRCQRIYDPHIRNTNTHAQTPHTTQRHQRS
uniref:Uncharacterized protein n=1 Tax=Mesocestoides corti TaxID=53468 RepID=A0A5K3EMM6_MESCO